MADEGAGRRVPWIGVGAAALFGVLVAAAAGLFFYLESERRAEDRGRAQKAAPKPAPVPVPDPTKRPEPGADPTPEPKRPPEQHPDLTPKVALAPPPRRVVTLADALAAAKEEGEALRKQFAAELPDARRLLFEDELKVVDGILARKADSRERFTAADLAYLRRCGLEKWVRANAIRWSCADPEFGKIAGWVWERSPQARSSVAVVGMAAQWGEFDKVSQSNLRDALRRTEAGEGCTEEERAAIILFAGAEYFDNRPLR